MNRINYYRLLQRAKKEFFVIFDNRILHILANQIKYIGNFLNFQNNGTSFNIYQTFLAIFSRLPMQRKKQFFVLLFAMLLSAALEILTIGCIALFVSSVSDPDAVLKSKYVMTVKEFLNAEFLSHQKGLIVTLSIFVMFLVILKNIVLANITFWSIRFGGVVDAFFGEKLLRGFLHLPYEWHLYRNSADLILAVNWRYYLGTYFIGTMLQLLCNCFVVLFFFITLLMVEPVVSLLCIGMLGCSGLLIYKKIRTKLDKTASIRNGYEETVNREVTKAIHGVKDIKVFGRENFFVRNYVKDIYDLARHLGLLQFFTGAPAWILEIVGFFMITTSISMMLFFMHLPQAKITGIVALLVMTAWRVLPATNRILSSFTSLRNSQPYVQKVFRYLDEMDESIGKIIPLEQKKASDISFNKELRIENIYFAYNKSKKYVLQDVNFVIKKGQTVGIIGISGAGKSTLVDILIGMLHPTQGRVLIDTVCLDQNLQNIWTKMIGYVSQSPYIYDGTLKENVAFGINEGRIDRDRVFECCSMAAMDFLDDLSMGIDTPIGERGVRLSGGQRQRVAIARALYHRPQVMIFDEATSALDTKNEKEIQKTIYTFKGKLTLIIVAHRLSTLEDCDVLIWIDKGKIKQIDTPAKILSSYLV